MSVLNTLGLTLAQAAPAAQPGAAGTLMSLLPIILMFVVLYFLMIRPQMKRQKEHKMLVENLKKGDEVVTAGGLLGKVVQVHENYITLDITRNGGEACEVVLQRVAVQAVLPKDTLKSLF